MGRPPALTKLSAPRIHKVRCRGGMIKLRALRLETGSYSWGSEAITLKTRILNCVYNAADIEFVRTNTLVKNAIIQVDAAPFRQWYENFYGVTLGKKQTKKKEGEEKKISKTLAGKHIARAATRNLDAAIETQFSTGRLLACISSRPGQVGKADGYILEGRELEFYSKRLKHK